MWQNTTGKRWFLTSDGKLATEEDPKAAALLVGVDGQIPLHVAEKYGLTKVAAVVDSGVVDSESDTDQKAKDAPPNKAKTPKENK